MSVGKLAVSLSRAMLSDGKKIDGSGKISSHRSLYSPTVNISLEALKEVIQLDQRRHPVVSSIRFVYHLADWGDVAQCKISHRLLVS